MNNTNFFPRMRTKKGFTLVETLVAVFVITMAIAGTMAAVSKGLQSSYYSRDQITAFFLADEAMEIIRNQRDSNFNDTNATNWLNGIPNTTNTPQRVCVSAYPTPVIVQGTTNTDCTLKQDTNGNFSMTSGSNSKFIRNVDVLQVADDQIAVTVTMKWTTPGGGEKVFSFYKTLYNWKGVGNN